MRKLLVLLVLIGLTGCGSFAVFDDGYQYGDVSRALAELQKRLVIAQTVYCTVTGQEERTVAIELFQKWGLDYSDEGFCGLELTIDLVGERVANATSNGQ